MVKKVVLESRERLKVVYDSIPSPKSDELLIKVKSCGICGADIKSYKYGHRDLTLPRVLGHEITGIVADVGRSVESMYSIGDRVQVSPGVFCMECDYCKAGHDNMCNEMEILGFHRDGGMQEYLLMDKNSIKCSIINPLPPKVSYELGTLAEPIACSLNMQDKLNLDNVNTLLIIGAGRLGTLHYLLAKLRGVPNIIIADTDPNRLTTKLFKNVVHVDDEDLSTQVDALTSGTGACATIICCPAPEVLPISLECTKKNGAIGYFSGFPEGSIPFKQLNLIHYKEINLVGSYGCKEEDNLKALEILNSEPDILNWLDHKIISIDEVERGIRMLENRETLSVIIKMKED